MYSPRPLPTDSIASLARAVESELRAIVQAFSGPQDRVRLNVLYAAPAKPQEGEIVRADGTSWNPGGGAGAYQRLGGAWVKL